MYAETRTRRPPPYCTLRRSRRQGSDQNKKNKRRRTGRKVIGMIWRVSIYRIHGTRNRPVRPAETAHLWLLFVPNSPTGRASPIGIRRAHMLAHRGSETDEAGDHKSGPDSGLVDPAALQSCHCSAERQLRSTVSLLHRSGNGKSSIRSSAANSLSGYS